MPEEYDPEFDRGLLIVETYEWWWALDTLLRAQMCLECGGSVGDATLTNPPEYLVEAVQQQPDLMDVRR